MPKHLTILNCSRRTATIVILSILALFLLIGCASLFRSAGLSDDQAAQQTAELKLALADATASAIATAQAGLTQGHELKTIAVKTASVFLWKIIAAGASSAGIILTGLLAKWLGTEKKITKALITGVEKSKNITAKTQIYKKASAAGIETQLHKRVQSLT